MIFLGIFLVVFMLFTILRVPIPFSMCIGAMVTMAASGMKLAITPPAVFSAIADHFAFLAVPAFIYAGELMTSGGVSRALLNFIGRLLGRIRGSLGAVAVITSVLFGTITGSSLATISAIGGIMIPEMIRSGYSKSYTTALIAVEIGEGRRRRGDPRDGEFFDLPWCSAGLVVLGLGRMDRAPGQDGGRAFRGGTRPDSGLAGTSPALWALSRVSEAARWFPEQVPVSVVLNRYDLVFPRSLVWDLVEDLRERLVRETDRVRRVVVACGVMPQPVIGVVFCP